MNAAPKIRQSLVKPNRPLVTDLAGLATMVGDGESFGVGGHHFARLPIALLRAIAERAPKNLRYVSWAGGLPLEMLLEAGLVASIDICFSSLDIFGMPKHFRAAAEGGTVPVRDWTALAMIQALRAGEANLPSLPFQLPAGSDMMDLVPGAIAASDPVSGEPVGFIPALRLDTVVLHAPRADALGNVEIYGARAQDWPMVGAARKVLVTVEKIVPTETLQQGGRSSILTRNRVSAIAEVPGGAWPTSCLPFYVTDYAALRDAFASPEPLRSTLRLPDAGLPAFVCDAARIAPTAATAPSIHPVPLLHPSRNGPLSIDEIMAVRIAAELDSESFASAGAVSPLANVAYRLAKRTHAPDMIITTMSCGHLDIAPSPLIPSLLEGMDAATAVAHAGGDDTYSTYYQAGAVTHEIIAAAQVDSTARVNNIAIRRQAGGIVRLPGQGGMADVANMHRNYIVYVTRHSPLSLVQRVDQASCGRAYVTDEEREKHGYRPGVVKLITDLCVFTLDPETRELVVTELMPKVTRDHIRQATGFPVRFTADCAEIAPPTAETLRILREAVDPLGVRRLEFVASRDRAALLAEILADDRATVLAIIGAAAQRGATP